MAYPKFPNPVDGGVMPCYSKRMDNTLLFCFCLPVGVGVGVVYGVLMLRTFDKERGKWNDCVYGKWRKK